MSAAPSTPQPRDPTWDGLRVLIVEDDVDSRELLRQLIEHEGGVATAAAHAFEALDRLRASVPDVVLVDLRMPVLDGIELVTELRQDLRLAHVPMIAVTAYTTPADRQETARAGFDAHVPKPVDFDALTATVRRLLRERRPRGERRPPGP
ncbi:MAG: response regulator [Candidatus Rokuibacteriota bacterium]